MLICAPWDNISDGDGGAQCNQRGNIEASTHGESNSYSNVVITWEEKPLISPSFCQHCLQRAAHTHTPRANTNESSSR